MMVTGRQVKADEALRIGLADEVVEPEALMARALELAGTISTGATVAARIIKRVVNEGIEIDIATGLAGELVAFEEVFRTEDSQVGVKSFLENGPGKATFTGR
jgi:enoyl-CoA hydratase